MYLLLFYRDMKQSGFYMNDDAIDIIGFDNVAKISGFKNRVLNYLINNKLSTSELEKYISTMRLNDIEKVNRICYNNVGFFINPQYEVNEHGGLGNAARVAAAHGRQAAGRIGYTAGGGKV